MNLRIKHQYAILNIGSILIWCITFIIPTLTSCAQNVITPVFPCTERLHQPYGITSHITRQDVDWQIRDTLLSMVKSANIDYVRCDLDFERVMPDTLKPMITVHLDSVVSSAYRKDVKILPILGYYTNQIPLVWQKLNLWDEYVSLMSRLYSQHFDYWEIWNEENLRHFWNAKPNGNEYAILLKNTSSILRQKGSNCNILIGALAGYEKEYLDQLKESDIGNDFNIMNFHSYCGQGIPEVQLRDCILNFSKNNEYWNKHVWITETGFTTGGELEVSEEHQAQCLPRSFILAFAYGVDKVFWYNLRAVENNLTENEDNYGILHSDLSPKAAYFAFKTLTEFCQSGSTRPTIVIDGSLYEASWERPDGKIIKAYWTTKGVKKVDLGEFKDTFSIFGENIKAKNIDVTQSLTYVIL